MKIYLAARYSRFPEMQRYAADLAVLGHEVTARWIRGDHDLSGMEDAETAERKRREWATEDLQDLTFADAVISFTEPEGPVVGRGRGGRHVEFGYAMALGLRLIIVGHRENVFHNLPEVEFHPNWEACLRALVGFAASGVDR